MQTRVVNRTPEWRFQAEVVSRLHKLEAEGWPFTCAGDMNRAKRNPNEQREAKLTGLTAGETDVRLYLLGGKLLSVEIKTPFNSRSKDQKKRHTRLEALGFEVLTLKAATPSELADAFEALIRDRLPPPRVDSSDGMSS